MEHELKEDRPGVLADADRVTCRAGGNGIVELGHNVRTKPEPKVRVIHRCTGVHDF